MAIENEQNVGQENEETTFTQEDLEQKLAEAQAEWQTQSEAQLNDARAQWEAQTDEKIKDAQTKAEQLAKLSQKEREAAEAKQRDDELAKREHDLNMREYKIEASAQLENQGLSTDFVDMVLSDDVDTTKENIAKLKTAFDKAVEATVTQKMQGQTPAAGSSTSGKSDISKALGL